MSTVWDDIADRLRETVHREARHASPPVRRGRVIRSSPLTVDLDGELLEAGDEDVEVDEALKTSPPAKGDLVRVHTDENHDYLISGRIVKG